MNFAAEKELVQKAQAGNTVSFGELVQAHQQFAYNVALRAINHKQEAEDIVQEAFIKAWQALPGYRVESRFSTWLYRIVMNLCYNRLPALRSDPGLEESGVLNRADSRFPDPVEHLETKQALAFVQRQIQELPGQHQVMLLLRFQEGCSYAEIAEIMDLPLGTVKTGIHRARERLKEAAAQKQEERVKL